MRIRPYRRIDLRGQIKIYNEDVAIVNKLLVRVNKGFFKTQQIRFFVILPTITAQG